MKKKNILFIVLVFCIATLCGCDAIKPGSPNSGDYLTQNANSALEYHIYVNKQITVYTNQLSTHMMLLQNSNGNYENIILSAEQSLSIMQDSLNGVIVTYPSISADDERLTVISTMETAITHMEDYIKDLKEDKDVSGYSDKFQNDYFALTGLANLHYQ